MNKILGEDVMEENGGMLIAGKKGRALERKLLGGVVAGQECSPVRSIRATEKGRDGTLCTPGGSQGEPARAKGASVSTAQQCSQCGAGDTGRGRQMFLAPL